MLAERLRPLFRTATALAAYHIPLDAHPEVGNNAILANRPTVLGAGPERIRRIGIASGSAADALPEAVALGLTHS